MSKIDPRCIPVKTIEVIRELTDEELDRTAGGASNLFLNAVRGALMGAQGGAGVPPRDPVGFSGGWWPPV